MKNLTIGDVVVCDPQAPSSFLALRTNLDDYMRVGDYILSSGEKDATYIDMKAALLNPATNFRFGRAIAELYLHHTGTFVAGLQLSADADAFAGSGLGGVLTASLFCRQFATPMLYVRPETRDHGMQNQIEGGCNLSLPPEHCRVTVVDDVFTTGFSLAQTILSLRDAGYQVKQALVLVSRATPEVQAVFETAYDVKLTAMYALVDVD